MRKRALSGRSKKGDRYPSGPCGLGSYVEVSMRDRYPKILEGLAVGLAPQVDDDVVFVCE